MEEEEKYKLPLLDPKFINDNRLWDSIWLMKKYPDNHIQTEENKIERFLDKAKVSRTDY